MTLLEEIRFQRAAGVIASREHGAIAEAVSAGRTCVQTKLADGTVLETLGSTPVQPC